MKRRPCVEMNVIYGITVELDRKARVKPGQSPPARSQRAAAEPGQTPESRGRAGSVKRSRPDIMLKVVDTLSSQSDLVLLQYC